ncbi:MAG: ribbon-helix-helix domain-containing protein [Labedaea sp.]
MKLSVSLPDEDVAFIDEYASAAGAPSRSSVIHQGLELLRAANLEQAYDLAWQEWADSAEADLWDATSADGLTDAQG